MRTNKILPALLAPALVFSGCGITMRDVPVPGTGVPGDTIKVTAEFGDALNLAEGAPVKVNGVDSGKVAAIAVEDFTAEVTLTMEKDSGLRDGATARLRYTTPLGELFVDITSPTKGTVVTDGGKLALDATETAPSVEDALAQASLLVNGGGLDQLQTVTEELNTALGGNESDYRALMDKARVFLTEANAATTSVDAVINSLNSLSKTLSKREKTINRAVREIRPAAKVLREHTPDFTRLLSEIEKFSSAANDTVEATRSQLLRMLQEVEPVLAEFAANKSTWKASLDSIVTASATAENVFATDYMNISLQLHLDGLDATGAIPGLDDLLGLIGLGGLLDGSLLGGLLGGRDSTSDKSKSPTNEQKQNPQSEGGLLGLGGLLGGLLGGGN